MNNPNPFSYKVCYKQQGTNRWKVYLVINTHDGALWHVRWYERHPTTDKQGQPLNDVTWLIVPITTRSEYKVRWRGCPF